MTTRSGRRLYMLSFDHRGSFEKGLMGIAGEPTPTERQRISELKALIYQGFTRAIADGAPREHCAVLVDEEFGSDIARSARREAYTLAMPVERSGQDEFDFEFGEHFKKHVEEFDPEFAKVLVRYNPEGDAELNRRQAERLAPAVRLAASKRTEVPLRVAGTGDGVPERECRRRPERL